MAECIHNKRSNDGKEKYPGRTRISVSDEEWYECDEPNDGLLAQDRPRSPSIVFDGEGIIIKGKSSLKKVPSPHKVNVGFKDKVTEIPRLSYDGELEQDEYLSIDENNLSVLQSSPRHFSKTQVYRAGTPAFRRGSPLPPNKHEGDVSSNETITWGRLGTDHIDQGMMHRAGTPTDRDGEFRDKLNDLNDLLKP